MKKTDPKLKSAMWSLIKEEISKILTESELKSTPLKNLKPGKYIVSYTVDDRDGVEETKYTLTSKDIASDITPQNFWKGIAKDDNLFTKGDSVRSVKKA